MSEVGASREAEGHIAPEQVQAWLEGSGSCGCELDPLYIKGSGTDIV